MQRMVIDADYTPVNFTGVNYESQTWQMYTSVHYAHFQWMDRCYGTIYTGLECPINGV